MKKIKAFTLLEILIVIAIIGIVAVSLTRSKRNTKVDTGRDAVNIIYKEMNQYLKDFQRNKVKEDENNDNIYKISYFRLNFGSTNGKDGSELTIGNYYNNNYFESGTLILGNKYTAFQYLKGAEKYTFRIRRKKGGVNKLYPIRISNNGKIYTGSTNNPAATEINQSEYQFLICGGEGGKMKPIGAITINAITKESKLDRCESEKYSGIECKNIFEDC